jgi:hypothetical protein
MASRYTPAIERFLDNIAIAEAGCWLWTASITTNGYAQFRAGDERSGHRFAYTFFVGPIPADLQIDHRCRVRHCVNPDHLEAVTPRANVLRGIGLSAENARKTHCAQGHEFTEANTYWAKTKYGRGRQCRECHRAREVRRRADLRRAS